MRVEPGDRVSRALTQLPTLTAPATLLPRVMAAVQAWAARPWYQRAWFTWPVGWQLATMAALVSAVTIGWEFLPPINVGSFLSSRLPVSSLSGDTGSWFVAVRLAASVLWRGMQPVLFYAFVIVVTMTMACLGAAAALNRAVFGRTQHS